MSSTNVDLGNVEYVYLRNVDCNNGAGADDGTEFIWNLPYINPKEAPYMFIQVVQLYMDYGSGATANTNKVLPQVLTIENYTAQNFYSTNGNSTQLASLIIRDAATGHFFSQQDAPFIQVPSNYSQISFQLHHTVNWNRLQVGNDASLDILLKIVRPKRDAITSNTLASYVRTLP